MRLFDTHCHFDFEPFTDQFTAHLAQAQHKGVERFLIPTIGPQNWHHVALLSSQYSCLYHALGIHPYFLNPDSECHLAELQQRLVDRPERCVAVGECGLDGVIDIDMAVQERVFIAQVKLAAELQLPLILHCRKAHNRMLQILKQEKFQYGGILHGFSGSFQQAMQFIELGFYIGVGGVITYPRANKTRQAVAHLPLEKLVLETDSPDMPLNGHQGKANHPMMIAEIVDCLATLRGIPKQTIAKIVWKNSNRMLGICE